MHNPFLFACISIQRRTRKRRGGGSVWSQVGGDLVALVNEKEVSVGIRIGSRKCGAIGHGKSGGQGGHVGVGKTLAADLESGEVGKGDGVGVIGFTSNELATNLVQGRRQRRRNLQVKGSIPLDSDEWYYTRGSGASAQRWKDDGWVLMVSFVDKPERKVTKSNQRKEARSNYSKFASPLIPKVFATREEALGYAVGFC